jgi:glycerol-3-phosphate acyltransferase PlsX
MAGTHIIALDAMSGDRGPEVAIAAALASLAQHPALSLIVVGQRPVLEKLLGSGGERVGDRLRIAHADEVVAMQEAPRDALRKKRDSSMRVAINLVKEGEAQACVSAGNTGALMATARYVLKTLPGIDRPAIASPIPAIGGHTYMLDLGANADCTSEHLLQFAIMGQVVAADMSGLAKPRIGLLNIGEEEIKGTEVIRRAAGLIGASGLNYVGFVEGDDIFNGSVDVVVSDGFTGNVALKTMEGAAHMVSRFMRDEFTRNVLTRAAALAAMPVLRSLKVKLDPRRYNGASLVGLRGIVIKSHGGADEVALGNAISTALLEVQKGVPTQISELAQRIQGQLALTASN